MIHVIPFQVYLEISNLEKIASKTHGLAGPASVLFLKNGAGRLHWGISIDLWPIVSSIFGMVHIAISPYAQLGGQVNKKPYRQCLYCANDYQVGG